MKYVSLEPGDMVAQADVVNVRTAHVTPLTGDVSVGANRGI